MKQYHFRLDDDDINSGIAHEVERSGSKQTAVLTDLLTRGLQAIRAEREQTAWLDYLRKQGQVANPDRVNYDVQAAGEAEREADVGQGDHPQAEGAAGVPL